jgi:hypothetical protein
MLWIARKGRRQAGQHGAVAFLHMARIGDAQRKNRIVLDREYGVAGANAVR